MKKILIIAVLAMTAMTAGAQKFALLDMEYILNRNSITAIKITPASPR